LPKRYPRSFTEVEKEGVAIRSNGEPIAYVISPQEFETTRLARAKRALTALDQLSSEISRNAVEQGLDRNESGRDLDRKAREPRRRHYVLVSAAVWPNSIPGHAVRQIVLSDLVLSSASLEAEYRDVFFTC
jgi:PHD/YefM family antitoxin component YafN of YafNO toxin-antitoxin module